MRTGEQLLDLAAAAQKAAYAPYSNYQVGAAIEDENGKVHTGCNVENASYGASICAERTAIFKMVSDGGRQIKAIAVVTKDGGPPCGMCLQVIREFVKDPESVIIWLGAGEGVLRKYTFKELLPAPFELERKG
jgi:cytidine deaminase